MRFFILFIALLFAPNVFAQGVQYTGTTGEWVLEKNYHSDTRIIDHCLIKNRYDNGTTFILAQNTLGNYRLALHFPHNNLVVDKAYDVDILIDDKNLATVTALVVTPSILAIALPQQTAIIEQIGRGNTLTIAGPKDMVQFALKGTANAIKKLKSCTITATTQESYIQEMPRLPQWLEKILTRIHMTDIKTIQIDNNQNLPLDYAWVTPDLFGGVKMIPYNREATSSENVINQYINIVERLCPNDFLTEPVASQKTKMTEFKPYDIVCSTGNGDTITSLLFGIEQNLITVFFFEGNAQGKSLEKRNSLLNVLTK